MNTDLVVASATTAALGKLLGRTLKVCLIGRGGLAKIDPKTEKITIYIPPEPMSGTAGTLDADLNGNVWVTEEHNVWTNLWSTDKVAKYNPSTDQWTLFELPTRGTESRHISLLERNGQPLRVIIPYERGRKVAVLTPRSEAELKALKGQAGR